MTQTDTLASSTSTDSSQTIQPAQAEPKAAASSHPCDDSLYLVWKKTPVKNLTTSNLHDYARRDAACKQAGSRSYDPNQGFGHITRTRQSDPKPHNGFHTLAIAGAMATVISGAILISIDDECDGITDFMQTEDQCREEAEDARGTMGGLTLISAMVMVIGMVGGME